MTANPTTRVTLKVNGQALSSWTSVRIVRQLKEICGSFELEYLDEGRDVETLTYETNAATFAPLEPGSKVELSIDAEIVLVGWIDKVKLKQNATELHASVSGRDICGDLVDCSAAPTGPAEYASIDLARLALQICKPFGIGVQVQTDIGAPFVKLALSPHEKAMPTIEKAARQRSVLITSDGVANLVLTTAGSSRGPDQIMVGYNVVESDFDVDYTHRFSDIYVKGQTARANGNHVGAVAPMTPDTAPGVEAPDGTATSKETAGIVMTGHAQDPEIKRYRPDVRMVRTQSGSSSVQEQAEWHVRVDRGMATKINYTVLDWRAGQDDALWLPNQLTATYDPYAEIDADMLIEGVEYHYSAAGARTVLHMVAPGAYDRINEASRTKPRHRLKGGK